MIYRIPFMCFLQFTLFAVSTESWLETINTYLSVLCAEVLRLRLHLMLLEEFCRDENLPCISALMKDRRKENRVAIASIQIAVPWAIFRVNSNKREKWILLFVVYHEQKSWLCKMQLRRHNKGGWLRCIQKCNLTSTGDNTWERKKESRLPPIWKGIL